VTHDQARDALRYYRGARGNKARKKRNLEQPITPQRAATQKLPEPKREFSDWGAISLKARRVLVLSDIHAPYFDRPALELAIEDGLERKVDAVLLNGDFMDFFSISRWLKDPRERDFPAEVAMGRELLGYFRDTFKGCQIWWKLGNHEERYEAYMWNKAPELLGVSSFNIESWMDTDKHNVRVIRDMQPIKVGNLNILHGHEYKFSISNPVNPARGIYLRAKAPAMIGHLHQSSEHTESNINGKITTCWSVGCLCNLRPRYSPLNKWNHGYAIVDTTGEEDFSVHNRRIWRGRIL